jgi:hypothetical protein
MSQIDLRTGGSSGAIMVAEQGKKMKAERTQALRDRPNIGCKGAWLLACVYINTPEELTRMGRLKPLPESRTFGRMILLDEVCSPGSKVRFGVCYNR